MIEQQIFQRIYLPGECTEELKYLYTWLCQSQGDMSISDIGNFLLINSELFEL